MSEAQGFEPWPSLAGLQVKATYYLMGTAKAPTCTLQGREWCDNRPLTDTYKVG
jgi:hypothetical protein